MFYMIYSPIVTLTVIAFLVSLFSNLVMKFTLDHHKMKNLKERMEKLREKMKHKDFQKDPEKYKDLLNEQYSLLNEQFRLTFKTMMINLLFLLPLYYYLKKVIGDVHFVLPFKMLFVGSDISWIWLYIFYSILFSFLIKKLLKLEY